MTKKKKKSLKSNPKSAMSHKTSHENTTMHKKHHKINKTQLIYFVGIPIALVLSVTTLTFAYNKFMGSITNTPKTESLKGGVVETLNWGTEHPATSPSKLKATSGQTDNSSQQSATSSSGSACTPKTITVPYKTTYQDDTTLPVGQNRVITYGVDGWKVVCGSPLETAPHKHFGES